MIDPVSWANDPCNCWWVVAATASELSGRPLGRIVLQRIQALIEADSRHRGVPETRMRARPIVERRVGRETACADGQDERIRTEQAP